MAFNNKIKDSRQFEHRYYPQASTIKFSKFIIYEMLHATTHCFRNQRDAETNLSFPVSEEFPGKISWENSRENKKKKTKSERKSNNNEAVIKNHLTKKLKKGKGKESDSDYGEALKPLSLWLLTCPSSSLGSVDWDWVTSCKLQQPNTSKLQTLLFYFIFWRPNSSSYF